MTPTDGMEEALSAQYSFLLGVRKKRVLEALTE
jgi:hypothetical protein